MEIKSTDSIPVLIDRTLTLKLVSADKTFLAIVNVGSYIEVHVKSVKHIRDMVQIAATNGDEMNKTAYIILEDDMREDQLNKLQNTGTNDLLDGFFFPVATGKENQMEFINGLLSWDSVNKKLTAPLTIPGKWERIPIKNLSKQITTSVDSFKAFIIGRGKGLIFEQSKRNRTPMILFRQQPFNVARLTLQGKENALKGIPILVEDMYGKREYLIPVSRYAEGMSRGGYYSQTEKEYCGTFYYWEPGSGVFLNCGSKILFSTNKLTAASELANEIKGELDNTGDLTGYWELLQKIKDTFGNERKDLYNELLQAKKNIEDDLENVLLKKTILDIDHQKKIKDLNQELKRLGSIPQTTGTDARMEDISDELVNLYLISAEIKLQKAQELFPGEYSSYSDIENGVIQDYYNIIEDKPGKLLNFTYDQYIKEFYAMEDPLDQPICKAGRILGYNVIVLSKMAGSTRIVTELLDTRPRIESFRNLVWEV